MARGNNEGTIYQSADGSWRGAVSLPTEPGSNDAPRRKYFRGATREQVSGKITKALRDLQTNTLVVDETSTLGEYLKQWVDAQASLVRPSTHQSYADTVRLHLSGPIARRPLARLSVLEVQGHLNAKLKAGLSARSVAYIRAVLRAALNDAIKYGFTHRNVAALAEPPKDHKPEFESRVFTVEEAKRFLVRARESRLGALFTVCLAVGLRKGEAIGLRWSDVDLEAGTLQVVQAIQRIKGKGLVATPPKSRKGRRALKLPTVAVDALKRHQEIQAGEREWSGSAWADSRLVFTNRNGGPVDPRNVHDEFKALLKPTDEDKAAGLAPLPDLRLHDLRHSAATLLLVQGVPARVVMEILGHSQISLTLGTYSHVLKEIQDEAALKMDAILGPSSEDPKNRVAATIAANRGLRRVK